MKVFFTYLFVCLCCTTAIGQQPTKIGLSLSGGGAKGLAHIGLLKVIDSAGIHIDYITGTSMGAIVGGLYAMGYTGNELEQIARKSDWGLLISNNVPLTDINIEEKDEFGRYIAEFPIVGRKPTLPLGAIEGQEMNRLLSDLTFPVHTTNNFDSLPIPFRCFAADILTGETVVLSNGYLPTAMRASMAIPSVFTPVKLNGRLLVDGGLLRNFPVADVKEMGADIVIGGYTGGRLYNEEELTTAIKLVYQSSSFTRVAESKQQMALCNVLANYDLELQNYSAASFNKVDSIIDIGYRVALRLYPILKHIADSLKMQEKTHLQSIKRYHLQEICISKINLKGASAETEALIMGKLALQPGGIYKVNQLNDAIKCVYGTRFFDKVFYTLEANIFGNEITIHVKESKRATFKFGLHYDNEQASGILANLTLRNVLGRGSRLVTTLDIAEYPKVRINYQKFVSKSQKIWIHGGYHYEFIPYRLFSFGRLQEELTNSYNNFQMGINKIITKNSYIGFLVNSEINFTRTKIYPEDRAVLQDSIVFRNQSSQEIGFSLQYFNNTLNSFLFPTQGIRTHAIIKFVPSHSYTNNFYVKDSSVSNNRLEIDAVLTPALKIQFAHTAIKRISKKISWVNNFFMGFIFDEFITSRPLYAKSTTTGLFFLGGVEQRQRINTVPFIGYRDAELGVAQVITYKTQVQIEVVKKLFITPGIAYQISGQRLNNYFTNITAFNYRYQDFSTGANHAFGYGITFAYNWFGGPISFTFYKASGVLNIRGYFTFGYKF